MWILSSKRPKYVERLDGPLSLPNCQKYVDRARGQKVDIPSEISFENVISNRSMPPCSLQDFMDYLVYVTHDAENLQFYLWMIDYFRRFANAPNEERSLSPKWTFDEKPPSSNCANPTPGIPDKTVTDTGVEETDANNSEDTSNGSTVGDHQSCHQLRCMSSKASEPFDIDLDSRDSIKQESSVVQPFRDEINRVVSHYIAPGSPRELNLSHRDRAALLYALKNTTHPSAFSAVKNMLDMTLRNWAHPNFIRWSICNGNMPRTYFLRGFAIMIITIAFIIAILFTLSSASRWFRIIAAAEWWFGITNLIAASQGLCVLLHRRHTRNIRPWEIAETHNRRRDFSVDIEASYHSGDIAYSDTKSRWPVRMEIFGPANNYLKERWIERDQRKSVWSKIKDQKVRVEETGLRILQNRIVWHAEAWAVMITIPLTAAFVALPKGNFY
ncbi:hypothetical protein MMC29_001524 [Sticta canariensis]|nr:hypothetical protein [Sticta canariensis]